MYHLDRKKIRNIYIDNFPFKIKNNGGRIPLSVSTLLTDCTNERFQIYYYDDKLFVSKTVFMYKTSKIKIATTYYTDGY